MMQQTEISPIAGAYLAAERIAKTGGMFSMQSPANGVKVAIEDLAVKILAAGFAQLAGEGALSLEIVEKKVLFVKSQRLVVRRGTGAAYAGALGRLFECCGDGETVKDAVRRWFGTDVTSPWGVVVDTAAHEARDAGLVRPAPGGLAQKLAGRLLSGTTAMTAIPEKREDLDAAAAAAAERWSAFQTAEPAIAAALLKEVSDGLKSRVETTDAGSFGD